jgi:hypothetical protein
MLFHLRKHNPDMGSRPSCLRFVDQGPRLINRTLGTLKPFLEPTPLLLELTDELGVDEPSLPPSLRTGVVTISRKGKVTATNEFAAKRIERAEC